MKKNYKTKRGMRLLITLMLMATLLLGCSSTEAETETAEAKPEVEATAPEQAEVEKEAPVEETNPEETESAGVEVEEEQPAEEETPQINYEPVELIEVTTFEDFREYLSSLDPNQAEILIYNGYGLYYIHLKEGQYYQLQPDDQIICNTITPTDALWDFNLGTNIRVYSDYTEFRAEYNKFEQNQEFFFEKILDNGEKVRRTCYLNPPTE